MKYTQAQKSEEQFISELEKILDKPEIYKVLALVHQHYFNPNDSIAQVWCIEDFSHLTPTCLSTFTYEEKMRALAYLENCDALEGDSEYAAMEEYFNRG